MSAQAVHRAQLRSEFLAGRQAKHAWRSAGFRIAIYADAVRGARSMALAPDGVAFRDGPCMWRKQAASCATIASHQRCAPNGAILETLPGAITHIPGVTGIPT